MQSLAKAVFRECSNLDCLLRFPDINSETEIISCPKCGSPSAILYSIDLTKDSRAKKKHLNGNKIFTVLDNIRSVYNVGSIFRTIQGFGLTDALLCGITPPPTHKNFYKTSLGAEEFINWQSDNNALRVCKNLKKEGFQIISLESCDTSIPVTNISNSNFSRNIALIVGNEIAGIDHDLLSFSDLVISIPILGKNKSYNVAIAFGIAIYQILYCA